MIPSAPRILILGATSAMAIETARCFASEGALFVLAARNQAHLATIEGDLMSRGASRTYLIAADLSDTGEIERLFKQACEAFGGLDYVLLAYGLLGDQAQCARDLQALQKMIQVNFTSAACWLTVAGNYFEAERRGTIAAIGSVAGDRGRKSNYVYGSAKGALDRFLQGLRNRLSGAGVRVLTIKPGFVDTPMTQHLPKGPLFVSAEVVGKSIFRALTKPRIWEREIMYVPWFWQGIMLIIRHIPESIFKRLSI